MWQVSHHHYWWSSSKRQLHFKSHQSPKLPLKSYPASVFQRNARGGGGAGSKESDKYKVSKLGFNRTDNQIECSKVPCSFLAHIAHSWATSKMYTHFIVVVLVLKWRKKQKRTEKSKNMGKNPTKLYNRHKVELHLHKEHKKSPWKVEAENSTERYNPKAVI